MDILVGFDRPLAFHLGANAVVHNGAGLPLRRGQVAATGDPGDARWRMRSG
jgi:hypothetical protein